MSERIIADFVGEFYLSGMSRNDPVQGRIVMSPRRLVLVGESRRETVPKTAVFDVAVGQVPPDLRQFFGDSVTIAYEADGERRMAIVEAGGDTIERFTNVLFRAQLNGREVTVEHPARRGGRVLDTPARPARLSVDEGRLGFAGPDVEFDVALATVTASQRQRRTLDGQPRPTLLVHHVSGTTALVTAVTLQSGRVTNILGRYLRLEYSELAETVADVSLSDEELQALVGLYATDGEADPADVITGDASRVALAVDGLREKGLLVGGDDGLGLTPKGNVAVNSRFDAVDD